nr:hypothetical protein [Tanacetum cinerariifolium]
MSAITDVKCVLTQKALDAFVTSFISQRRDPAPVAADFNEQDYATLVAYPSSFWKFLEALLCLVGLSRHYTFNEETYPRFCIRMERPGASVIYVLCVLRLVVLFLTNEGELQLLDTTIGRTVLLLPVAPDRAESELDLKEDHETPSRTSVSGKYRSTLKRLLAGAVLDAELGVAAMPTLPFMTAFISSTPEREAGDHTYFAAGLNLRSIGAPPRFVISLDSSYHYGTNVAKAKGDSLVRSSVSIMTTVTTITFTIDIASVSKEKLIKPSPFCADSSSAGGTDPTTSVFSDLTGSDFLVGAIRTIIDPDTDLWKIYLFTEFNVGAARQMSLSAEVRMRAEYNVKEKRRLKSVAERHVELLKVREGEIENLKAQLFLREAEATKAIRLLKIVASARRNVKPLPEVLELIKKEKERLDSKLTGFQTASKDLDSLLESQRLDKNKEGLRYSVVPSPPAQIYSPPKKDMSWTGLPEFADDIVTDYSRHAPTVESFPDDAQNRIPSVTSPRTRVAPAEEFALLVKIILSQRCINVSQRHINNSQQSCDSYARMVPAAAKIKEDCLDCEVSRALSFYLSFTRASHPQLHFGNQNKNNFDPIERVEL